jgi:hypothetical protein
VNRKETKAEITRLTEQIKDLRVDRAKLIETMPPPDAKPKKFKPPIVYVKADEIRPYIVRHLNEGWTRMGLAENAGISPKTIYYILQRTPLCVTELVADSLMIAMNRSLNELTLYVKNGNELMPLDIES